VSPSLATAGIKPLAPHVPSRASVLFATTKSSIDSLKINIFEII